MLDFLMPHNDTINFQHYIQNLENSKQEIVKNIEDKDIINKIILLSQTYTFFEDLKKYYYQMDLSDTQIENFILELDDLIDEFEEMQDMTSANKLKKEYYSKADNLYVLLINLQVELGFYLSDRKYGV
jgi:hypothetical protein